MSTPSATTKHGKASPAALGKAEQALLEGELKLAEALFEAQAEGPHKARALRGLGITRFKLRRYAQAEADFRASRALDGDDAETRLGLGLALVMQNKVYPALDELESLAADRPGFVRGRMQAGLLQIKLGAIARGREHLTAALEADPSPAERRSLLELLDKQAELDRRRIYRPDFVALNRATATAR